MDQDLSSQALTDPVLGPVGWEQHVTNDKFNRDVSNSAVTIYDQVQACFLPCATVAKKVSLVSQLNVELDPHMGRADSADNHCTLNTF